MMLGYAPILWAVVLIAAIVIETQTMDMITIWFMPSALIAMILGMLEVEFWVQCLVFVLLTTVLLILSKTLFKTFFKKQAPIRTNVDALLGQEAIILETVNNRTGEGTAKLNGCVWSVRAEDENEILSEGEVVVVKEIRGVKLICAKKES